MNVPLFIARRYLFAKKSHNVINLISWISAFGMMVGTFALIVVLSVNNGFGELIQSLYNVFDADLVIQPATGKHFAGDTPVLQEIRQDASVAAYCEIVEETVMVQYRGQQAVATMKGVDSAFLASSPLTQKITHGEFKILHGDIDEAVFGRMLAYQLGIGVHFIDPVYLHFPRRDANLNALNPQASLQTEKLFPAGVFAVEQNYDATYMFTTIALARRLLEYENEVTSIEIRIHNQEDIEKIQARFSKLLGPDFVIKNRQQQNEIYYKMMRSEKVIIYCILVFILAVIACNILGALALLIVDKREDIDTLRSLGANDKLIRRIFTLEGWLISFFGSVLGVSWGLLVCFLQQQFGFIAMSGNFIVSSYPVAIDWYDILIVLGSALVIGYLAARLPVMRLVNQK